MTPRSFAYVSLKAPHEDCADERDVAAILPSVQCAALDDDISSGSGELGFLENAGDFAGQDEMMIDGGRRVGRDIHAWINLGKNELRTAWGNAFELRHIVDGRFEIDLVAFSPQGRSSHSGKFRVGPTVRTWRIDCCKRLAVFIDCRHDATNFGDVERPESLGGTGWSRVGPHVVSVHDANVQKNDYDVNIEFRIEIGGELPAYMRLTSASVRIIVAPVQQLRSEDMDLPEETRDVIDGLRNFVAAEVRPRHDANAELFENPHELYDESGRFSPAVLQLRREVREASAKAGFYQLFAPESLGGGGQGALSWYAAWQDIHHRNGMKYWLAYDSIAHWVSGPSATLENLSPALKETVLPELLSGRATMCFGMSEPDAGSDVWRMRTTAVRDGEGWTINGTKQWTSNGPYADYALVFAVTDPDAVRARKSGISAFLVPTNQPGFAVDSVIKLFGHSGGNEAILSLSNVTVGPDALVGELHDGLGIGLLGIGLGRLFNAGKAVGLARWGLEQGVAYARDRETFGKPLIQHQSIAFDLAECAMEILPAHLAGLHAAKLRDHGKDALKETAIAKATSVEMAARTFERVIQTMGGIGFTNELGLGEAWQDMRILHVADGSAQMQRRIIAGRLAAGDWDL